MTPEERRAYNKRYYQAHKAERLAKERERRMLHRIGDGRYGVQRQASSHGYYRAENIKRAYNERRKQQNTTAG
jgi:hypothetical protein